MLILKPDESIEERVLEPGTDGEALATFQDIVGGSVEVIHFATSVRFFGYGPPGLHYRMALINEDGKRLNLPVNRKATTMWWQANGARLDYLVGNVVFVTEEEFQ